MLLSNWKECLQYLTVLLSNWTSLYYTRFFFYSSSSYHFPRGLSTIDTQPTQGTEGGGGGGEDELFSKIIVEVKGHDPKVLDSYYWYLKQTAFHLDLGPHDT